MTNTQKQPTIDRTGWWVLFATISASSMAFLMQAALNLALPAIQIDLGASGADLLWITNAYALPLGALLLVGGSLGDRFGRERIYIIGIIIYSLAALLCGLAPATEFLIIARGLQGVGGAMMIPGSLALVSAYFDSDTRGRAIGIWSAGTTITSVLGPILGGILAEQGLWRAIFLLTIPFALASLFALIRYVPESRNENAFDKLDYPGALLVILGMGGIVYGATEIGRAGATGFTNPVLLVAMIGGILALVGFVIVEGRSDHPMMPLSLFKSSTFTGANLLTLFLYGALYGALFFFPLNLIQVQGYGETVAGLAGLPTTFALVLLSPRMGSLVDRYGPRRFLIAGPIIAGLGFIALMLPGITAGPADYWVTYFPGQVLFGVGMGITVAPLTTTVMGAVSQENAGIASGVNNAVSRSAGVLATAILGGVALLFFSNALTANLTALDLNSDTETAIVARAEDLAGLELPDSVDDANQEAARESINLAFVDTFRLMMGIAAVMAFLSALLAAMTIKDHEVLDDKPGNHADSAVEAG